MNIINIHVTDGPNYWSVRRHRLVVMQLNLEDLEFKPTDQLPGFRARLEDAMPGLQDHHCSEGHAGGFFERVEDGTWMGHVIEHIALELQVMAGLDVSFGRTRGTGTEGEYHVVFDCIDEESGRLTAEIAVEVADKLAKGKNVDVSGHVEDIRNLSDDYKPGPSTASILREARRRNIPSIKLEDSSTHQLGYGARRKKIAATIASTTSNLGVETACDKEACRRIFKEMAIPVAKGAIVYDKEELHEVVDELGFPLVVKPISGNHGRGITTNIRSSQTLRKAYDSALTISDHVIVERHIEGYDFRLLVVNHQMVAAAKRTPAHVVGDGSLSIKELIREVNRDPRRGEGHNNVLTKITVGNRAKSILRRKGYTLSTVLANKEVLYLDHVANISQGGTATDVTDMVHPSVTATAERISRLIDLDICGIDLIAPQIDAPLTETGGVVLEVNAAPGLRMHLAPSVGEPRNVAAPIIGMLFPDESEGRIPITAVTGTNGKTTTTRLIAHIMRQHGGQVGYTTTDGVYINDELVMTGDCGGPQSARLVLKDPTVDTAVLECARGGILRSGLGFDQCDVGVVTNVASDHLGLKGIDSMDKLARVKSTVPESVRAGGYAVLNAADDYVYAMKEHIRCNFALFSLDPEHPRIQQHLNNNGICAVCEDESITIKKGRQVHTIEKIENIPLSFGGRAGFMLENILAATAAAYVQGVPVKTLSRALKSFAASPEQIPGRMNLFSFDLFDVMIDYAHNPAGMAAIKNFIDCSSYNHATGIIAAVGDRRAEDIKELGRIAGDLFDSIIIREDSDLRGRKPGEASDILRSGIGESNPQLPVTMIADEKEALQYAIKHVNPGSLIFLSVEKISDILSMMQKRMAEKEKSSDIIYPEEIGAGAEEN